MALDDRSTEDLKDEFTDLHSAIYSTECFSLTDLQRYFQIGDEQVDRGVESVITETVDFCEAEGAPQ